MSTHQQMRSGYEEQLVRFRTFNGEEKLVRLWLEDHTDQEPIKRVRVKFLDTDEDTKLLDTDEDSTCGTCGEYAEDGYLCEHCRACEENQALCEVNCLGKIHHATEASADDHVTSLVADDCPGAYAYECECNECEWDCGDGSGHHWHVASSTVPRRMREWVS